MTMRSFETRRSVIAPPARSPPAMLLQKNPGSVRSRELRCRRGLVVHVLVRMPLGDEQQVEALDFVPRRALLRDPEEGPRVVHRERRIVERRRVWKASG